MRGLASLRTHGRWAEDTQWCRLHYNACITRFLPERRSIRPGRGPEPAEVFWDVGDGEDPPGWLPGPENLPGLL